MKVKKYFCPAHPDVMLYEEQIPETFMERIKLRMFSSTFFSTTSGIFWVDVGGINFSDDNGPYECEQCKKHYHKWECVKK